MGSLKKMESYWWETKPQRLNEWLYDWRKRLYHKNPRTKYVEDYELSRIAAIKQELQEKISTPRQTFKGNEAQI